MPPYKPVKSKAQARKLFALANRGEISEAGARGTDRASAGGEQQPDAGTAGGPRAAGADAAQPGAASPARAPRRQSHQRRQPAVSVAAGAGDGGAAAGAVAWPGLRPDVAERWRSYAREQRRGVVSSEVVDAETLPASARNRPVSK